MSQILHVRCRCMWRGWDRMGVNDILYYYYSVDITFFCMLLPHYIWRFTICIHPNLIAVPDC
ncbi:hypothetical protein C8R48DRAFT_697058 [Suillus tomentosus]|nr:hypothetical protein C8R48DRAFT_697058 [Suillus tomentosus]